jgi:hypothetical protein
MKEEATRQSRAPIAIARAIVSRATWLFPLVVGAIAIVPALWALYGQSFATFGRDQGIFQYVAWALRHGERAYRDIHEINGPLPHAWYMLMQGLGGEDEHVFRSIDTLVQLSAYIAAASAVPRWVDLDLAQGAGPRARRGARLAWILAGVAVFAAQYDRYDWWHTTQREALYAALIVSSLTLQSIGHATRDRRRAIAAFFFAGLLTSLTWFGKPPCAVFALVQAFVVWFDRKNIALPLGLLALAVAASAIVVGGSMLAFVTAYGDLALGIEILSKVPRLHHTIWNETLLGSYRAYDNAPRLDWAMATFVAFVVVYRWMKLPRRALLAIVLPIGGAALFIGQGKAFPYHLHMLTLGTAVMQVVLLAAIARHLAQDATSFRRWQLVLAGLGVAWAIGLGVKSAQDAWMSPSVRGRWASIGATPEKRASRAYFDHFGWGDFFANDLRDAAAYLTFHTRADERVQTYGFDPYLLFLARRKSATPVMYDFELNVDAALEGGKGARPSAELKSWLLAYRDEAEKLVLQRVEAAPPAAFALLDRAPFTHPKDAEADFAAHCPHLYSWMTAHYSPAATFGTARVWLRHDVLARDGTASAP